MCHFQSLTAHQILTDMGYEYHFRLDVDSLLTHPLEADPIEEMHLHGQTYAYALAVQVRDDADGCTYAWNRQLIPSKRDSD